MPGSSPGRSLADDERLASLVRHSTDLIVVIDEEGRVLFANPAVSLAFGVSSEEALGTSVSTYLHPDDREWVMTGYDDLVRHPGVPLTAAIRFVPATGDVRVLETVTTNCLHVPSVAGIVINGREVTERTSLARALRTLGGASEILVDATDEGALLADICSMIVEAGGYPLAWVGFAEHDEARTVRPVAWAGESAYLREVHVSWADNEHGQGPVGVAIRTRCVQTPDDLGRTWAPAMDREAAARHGLRSGCVLPLQVGGEVIGVLSIYAAEPNAFGPSEVVLLIELAEALAFGLGQIRDAG